MLLDSKCLSGYDIYLQRLDKKKKKSICTLIGSPADSFGFILFIFIISVIAALPPKNDPNPIQ